MLGADDVMESVGLQDIAMASRVLDDVIGKHAKLEQQRASLASVKEDLVAQARRTIKVFLGGVGAVSGPDTGSALEGLIAQQRWEDLLTVLHAWPTVVDVIEEQEGLLLDPWLRNDFPQLWHLADDDDGVVVLRNAIQSPLDLMTLVDNPEAMRAAQLAVEELREQMAADPRLLTRTRELLTGLLQRAATRLQAEAANMNIVDNSWLPNQKTQRNPGALASWWRQLNQKLLGDDRSQRSIEIIECLRRVGLITSDGAEHE